MSWFKSSRAVQLYWLVLAAGFITAAGFLQGPLDRQAESYELVAPGNVVLQNHPGFVMLQMAPGGLRALAVNVLWIRAERLKNDGRYHESMQLSEMCCNLQPRFSGVWLYHSWNMAWNISVATSTPQERWMWVNQGLTLIREKGIPLNPKSLGLYRELSWIFYNKMGGGLDEMHMVYKRRWAGQMQRLLGTPPVGESPEVVDAFRPIAAENLIDKSPRRQGKADEIIQRDRLEKLKAANPDVAQYCSLLQALNVRADKATTRAFVGKVPAQEELSALEAYNFYSQDESCRIVRPFFYVMETQRDKDLAALINKPELAAARGKLHAFLRAQILWNQYKMDPAWMLGLMEKYGPLDWRHVLPNGLYWSTYGFHFCGLGLRPDNVETINNSRIVLNCLKELTWVGRLSYVESVGEPDMPEIQMWSDWRFIKPTLTEFDYLTDLAVEAEGVDFVNNTFNASHMNYMTAATQMMWAADRPADAQELYDLVRDKYQLRSQPQWQVSMEDWIASENRAEDKPTPSFATQQSTSALVSGFARLSHGNLQTSQGFFRYAELIFAKWQKDALERYRVAPFEFFSARVLSDLLTTPEIHGRRIALLDRVTIWARLDDARKRIVFDQIIPELKLQCDRDGLDVKKAFPEPPGMADYRAKQSNQVLGPPGGE